MIFMTDSFVFKLRHCVDFKAIRYKSINFSRIVAEKSHPFTPALRSEGG